MISGDIETTEITEKVEYEDLLKNYYEKMEIIEEQDKEIERLNKQIEEYQKALDETTSEKADLENIIKEVREYIEKHIDNEVVHNWYLTNEEAHELLEILDKENMK